MPGAPLQGALALQSGRLLYQLCRPSYCEGRGLRSEHPTSRGRLLGSTEPPSLRKCSNGTWGVGLVTEASRGWVVTGRSGRDTLSSLRCISVGFWGLTAPPLTLSCAPLLAPLSAGSRHLTSQGLTQPVSCPRRNQGPPLQRGSGTMGVGTCHHECLWQ